MQPPQHQTQTISLLPLLPHQQYMRNCTHNALRITKKVTPLCTDHIYYRPNYLTSPFPCSKGDPPHILILNMYPLAPLTIAYCKCTVSHPLILTHTLSYANRILISTHHSPQSPHSSSSILPSYLHHYRCLHRPSATAHTLPQAQ